MFNDKHEFFSFKTSEERAKYWIGRPVQSKVPIRKNLYDFVPANTVGLVQALEESDNGLAYLLVVRWSDGSTYPCYQYSIFSYNKGEYGE